MSSIVQTPKRDRWAHLRFSIIGSLLAAPPAPGGLMASLQALAAKPWRHPDTALDVRFSTTTLERWYYAARRSADPVAVLRDRKIDDRSRLVCHLQWYLDETAQSLVHALCQAFMKRDLPRALMTDNGAAMLAEGVWGKSSCKDFDRGIEHVQIGFFTIDIATDALSIQR